ncbi:MAG: ASCH domain-containing protein [Candidatus Zixiibacteriota bacterium]
MKAISLWQPWASAIAVRAKTIETRSWRTSYRGRIAIHAAKRCRADELRFLQPDWTWMAALSPLGVSMGGDNRLIDVLKFGVIVATARLVDCRPTESFTVKELDTKRTHGEQPNDWNCWTERAMGDFTPGRWGWVLTDVIQWATPLPWRGAQGLFDIPLTEAVIGGLPE